MKKYIFGAVFSLALLASPAFTQAAALTQDQINAIISLLQSFGADSTTIANVNTALNGNTTVIGDPRPWCHTFNKDMTVGSSGDDVSALYHAIALSNIVQTPQPDTSIFGELMAGYVVEFQAKYGIRQTGYVGPITRAKLNSLYGCPPVSVQPHIDYVQAKASPINIIYTGEEVTIFGHGFLPNSTVTVFINDMYSAVGVSASGQTNADGTRIAFVVPTNISAGNYALYVKDPNAPGSNSIKITVKVPDDVTQPSITVLSPNGGETLKFGESFDIRWKTQGVNKVYVSLVRYDGSVEQEIQRIANGISASSGKYTWQVPSDLFGKNDGWRIKIVDYDATMMTGAGPDMSDAPFSIVAAPPVSTPVTLSSITPSSGPVGTSVRLDGCGSDSTSGFTLVYSGPRSGTAAIPVETLGAASGCGYMTFSVPTDFPTGVYTLSVKNNQTGTMSTNTKTFTVTASASASWSLASYGGRLISKLHFVSPTKIYGIGLDGGIWRYNGGGSGCTFETCWARITNPSIKDDFILVNNSESNIYALGLDNQIWHWNGSAWSLAAPGGQLQKRLWYANPNLIYGIGLDNQIWKWTGGSNWAPISAGWQARDFVLLAENDIYILGLDNQIWHWNGSTWSPSSGGQLQKRLWYVNPNLIYGIGLDNQIWKWTGGSNWSSAAPGGQAKEFFLRADNDIYILGLDDQIWHWGSATVANNPVASVSPTSFGAGASFPGLASALGAFSGAGAAGATKNQIVQSTSGFSYIWNRDLQIGSPYQGDVIALQQALTREGVYAGEITGGFYNQTYAAVQAFQRKYGIDATGYVGALTRSKLNILFAQQ